MRATHSLDLAAGVLDQNTFDLVKGLAAATIADEAGFCQGGVRLAHVKQLTPNRYACQHATVNIHFRLVALPIAPTHTPRHHYAWTTA